MPAKDDEQHCPEKHNYVLTQSHRGWAFGLGGFAEDLRAIGSRTVI